MSCGSLPSRWGLYASGGSRRAIWPLLIVIALLGMGEARAQGGWSGAIADIAGPFSSGFALVGVSVDDPGNAIAVWQTESPGIVNIRAARYTVASNTWAPGVDLAAEDFTDYPGGMAVMANDDEGNVVVAWASRTRVRAVSYLAGAGAWTAPQDVATFPFAQGVTIAGNGPGQFVLAWVRGASPASIESARFTPMTNTWTVPVTVSSDLPCSGRRLPSIWRGTPQPCGVPRAPEEPPGRLVNPSVESGRRQSTSQQSARTNQGGRTVRRILGGL